uniref:Uncharacterized protein n=1 Tax=Siphoviridae sp. ctBeL15 TaxID=2825374 RepID=A0A8S5V090_9CAUD|nr:MAG TPA: hypothetical protein [Siphoviridae sp. ctBeL15]
MRGERDRVLTKHPLLRPSGGGGGQTRGSCGSAALWRVRT